MTQLHTFRWMLRNASHFCTILGDLCVSSGCYSFLVQSFVPNKALTQMLKAYAFICCTVYPLWSKMIPSQRLLKIGEWNVTPTHFVIHSPVMVSSYDDKEFLSLQDQQFSVASTLIFKRRWRIGLFRSWKKRNNSRHWSCTICRSTPFQPMTSNTC